MADLLECVIQIKALGETLERITRLIPGEDESGALAQLAGAERRYALALGTDGTARPGAASSAEVAADTRVEFVVRRRANLARLEGCTAAELAGFVAWPGRRSTTVADLVAIMLANDTEILGEVRRTGSSPGRR